MIERFFYLKKLYFINGDIFPTDHTIVTKIKDLSGSTKPELVSYNNTYFVKKKSQKSGHTKSEFFTHKLYQISGCPFIPNMMFYDDNNGTCLLSEYIDGELLTDIIKKNNQSIPNDIINELKKYFVLDCLFMNWDVMGGDYNNIIVKDGKCYRIDLGGSLEFRAQGEKKKQEDLKKEVIELDGMRKNINFTTYLVFNSIQDNEIKSQIKDLLQRKKEIIELLEDDYEGDSVLFINRITYLEEYLKK